MTTRRHHPEHGQAECQEQGGGGPVPQQLGPESPLRFDCHAGVACFNACCRRADLTLTPYDVIRLKRSLGLSSEAFLQAHTVPYAMDQHGLPGIKMRTDETGACLFLGSAGCRVYSDRPTACRDYPLGQMALKPATVGQEQTHFFLVREDHCLGHGEPLEQPIESYRTSQELADYDAQNRDWLQIILKKRSAGPTVGQPPRRSLELFFMASYDMDRFRRFVLSDSFAATYQLDAATRDSLAGDDIALLQFGMRFMRQVFFAERTLDEQPDAWERRVTQRESQWQSVREEQVARRIAGEDERYTPEE